MDTEGLKLHVASIKWLKSIDFKPLFIQPYVKCQPDTSTHLEFWKFDRYNSSSTITGGMLHVPSICPETFPPKED